MINYLTNSPFRQQKGIHVLVMLEYNTRQKQNQTKPHPTLIPHAGQTPAPDLYLKGGLTTGEQCLVESFPTRVTPYLIFPGFTLIEKFTNSLVRPVVEL